MYPLPMLPRGTSIRIILPRYLKTSTMIVKLHGHGSITQSAVVCADRSWISCISLHSYIAACKPVKMTSREGCGGDMRMMVVQGWRLNGSVSGLSERALYSAHQLMISITAHI